MMNKRTSPRKKATQIAKHFRSEDPDYGYLRTVFMHLRKILEVEVKPQPKKLPCVPREVEIEKYYEAVWKNNNIQDVIIIKLLFYGFSS